VNFSLPGQKESGVTGGQGSGAGSPCAKDWQDLLWQCAYIRKGTGRSCSQDELMAAGCGLSLVCKVLKHKIKRNESTACKSTTK